MRNLSEAVLVVCKKPASPERMHPGMCVLHGETYPTPAHTQDSSVPFMKTQHSNIFFCSCPSCCPVSTVIHMQKSNNPLEQIVAALMELADGNPHPGHSIPGKTSAENDHSIFSAIAPKLPDFSYFCPLIDHYGDRWTLSSVG
ncbi:MAG: hypothetical protein P0Y53_06095 [Candidatus Pseudobacter hemicellulosilyticus]|uniref:Uncharacterized protein n=1 Tax=Candidatus Pseudobacter hemicellulosilyticus TaxID=3121375 RepID=A0AAJ5WTZ5_9BACT|nr:MAG: hypothetical protein P0Y53_06095 [Pseudobacter sp.]